MRVGTFECLKVDETIIDHLPQNWEIEPSVYLPVDIQILYCVDYSYDMPSFREFLNFPVVNKNNGLIQTLIFRNVRCLTKRIELIDSLTSLSIIVVQPLDVRAVYQQISVPGHKVDGLLAYNEYNLRISNAVPATQIK